MKNKNVILTIGILMAILLAGMFTSASAQTQKDDAFECILPLENNAEPEIGFKNFIKLVYETIDYPKGLCAEGRVFIQMTIEVDGTCSNMEVLRGIGERLDKEAVRAVKEACKQSKWKPGEVNGKPVRQKYIMPVKFTLSE